MDSFSSDAERTWFNMRMADEAAEDDDLVLLPCEDEEARMGALVMDGESRPRRPRDPDAPPKQIRQRDHAMGDARIRADYFGPSPVYSDLQFWRRFRMRRHVFERLVHGVEQIDPYFLQRVDATGRLGLTGLQKCVAAIRILAYGLPADAVDEYVRIGESTARESLHRFCEATINAFGAQYLRPPNAQDIARILAVNAERGFPRMIGSIDCMHWEWRNCPTAWKGMFTGRGKHPTMILEAAASHDLWIWHAYFGMPGSCNDINVLQRSPVFSAYIRGESPPVSFTVNGNTYDLGYYLADGIYPDWPAFVKTVQHPKDQKTQHFATLQESVRKDIERAFGVLQARWAVVRGPAYGWDRDQISNIMTTCILLHNMIIEDEGRLATNRNFDRMGEEANPSSGSRVERSSLVQALHKLKDKATSRKLQCDLIEHNWMRYGST